MNKRTKLLIVDDEEDFLKIFSAFLTRKGFNVVATKNGFEAIEQVKKDNFSFILLDVVMPGMNGVEAFKRIKAIRPECPVAMMTAYAVEELLDEAKREGAVAVFKKPIDLPNLTRFIRRHTVQKGGK